MELTQRRPAYWTPGYDTAHLAVPVLLVLLAVLLAFLPAKPRQRTRIVPPAPPVIRPTTILSPLAGSAVGSGQTVVVDGLAHPGGVVRLYWYAQPIGEPTVVALDGRWQFTLANLPPGTHTVRAGALVAGRSIWSSEVVFTVAAPATRPTAKPAPKKPAAKAPANSTKTRKPANARP